VVRYRLLDCVKGQDLDVVLVHITATVDVGVQGDRTLYIVVAITDDIVVALQKHACRTLGVMWREHGMQALAVCSDKSSEAGWHARVPAGLL